jgi:hypothetical protein
MTEMDIDPPCDKNESDKNRRDLLEFGMKFKEEGFSHLFDQAIA